MAGFGFGNLISPQVGGFIDSRRNALAGLGAGLLNGQPGAGVQAGLQADDAYATQQKAEAERQKAIADQQALRAKYADFFIKQNKPDIAQGIADGVLNPGEEYIKHITPKPKGAPLTLSEGEIAVDPTTFQTVATNPKATVPAGVGFDDTSGLRKEVLTLPSYKNLTQAKPIFDSMVETADRNTRASDLNLVYGLGKIMDPGSVVREGEMFMVQGINTLPDKLIEGINSVLTGSSSLSPETRQAILEEAYGRLKQYESAFQQDAEMYKGIAGRNKINPLDVLPQFQPSQPWQPHSAEDPLGIRGGP